jgi:hypothetical protein
MFFSAAHFLTLGCKSIERFDSGPNGAYCGTLVGTGFATDGLIPDVDAGASSLELEMALTLDSKSLTTYPGRLSSNDAQGGLCEGTRLFDGALVRTVQPSLNDVVASMQLTADHVQDIFTWVDSTCQGTFVIIVSLIHDGTVELRLFKPAPLVDAGAPAKSRPGFGVFKLTRNALGCGF